MLIVILIFLVLVYISLPLPLQIILFAVNMFFPDPIPMLDEVIMCVSMANKAKLISRICSVFEKSKILGILIVGAIIAAIIAGIVFAWNTLDSFIS